MKSPIKFAFFMAMPLEAANAYYRSSFDDFRVWVGPISVEKLMNGQFRILHWPGLYASDWFANAGFPSVGNLAVFASGYIDTVLLLILAIELPGWFFRRGAKRPAVPDNPPED